MQELKNGRYTFEVHFPESKTPYVFVQYNGKSYRCVRYDKESVHFESQYNEKMTPSLLKALILTLITFETEGTTSFKELTAKRIKAWVNSIRYTTDREKFAECPFGCV